MRYLLVLPLVVALLAGCSKNDRETINGTWSFYELKGSNGKLVYSAEKAEQNKITEETVKEQLPMMQSAGMDEAALRKMISEQFTAIGKTTFTFDEKGTVKTAGTKDENATESKFTMDEKKKEITIKSKDAELTYKYSFKDDRLVMKGKAEEFTLQKK